MPDRPCDQVTQLLIDWSKGDEKALEALPPLVYEELRRLARGYMSRERPNHTLQATGLVHEAYVRMVDQRVAWKSRGHFFGIAAKMMRRILVDHAKKAHAAKRGAGQMPLSLDDPAVSVSEQRRQFIALDDALNELAQSDPERCQIVELRFFGGLSNEESSEVLGIAPATVQRKWAGAKAWLYHELSRRDTNE
jgi:RNA polymerase sigma factor (TIGR02999 family)